MRQLSPESYTVLRKKVEQTLLLGQQKIEEAKVLTYWKTGQLIDQHIRDHTPEGKERAAYNTQVVENLTKDLKISDTVLYRCVRFAQQFKKVAARPLSWAHYRALIAVQDKTKRLTLADLASKGEWSSRDLEIEIRNLLWDERAKASDGKAPSLLPVPVLGLFYTYQIIRPESIHSHVTEPLLDVGFSGTKKLTQFTSSKSPAGAIVTSVKDAKGHYNLGETRSSVSKTGSRKGVASPESRLYNYQAFVTRVIDGDTLKLEIDTGFDDQKHETIRLRGIDCPELDTPEGRAAKRFVERELAHCEYIILKSTRTPRKEKWGRYLGDIFYADKTGKQQYLNNLLLEKGYAVRVRE